jgi:hypothetical protein
MSTGLALSARAVVSDRSGTSPTTLRSAFNVAGALVVRLCITHTLELGVVR